MGYADIQKAMETLKTSELRISVTVTPVELKKAWDEAFEGRYMSPAVFAKFIASLKLYPAEVV